MFVVAPSLSEFLSYCAPLITFVSCSTSLFKVRIVCEPRKESLDLQFTGCSLVETIKQILVAFDSRCQLQSKIVVLCLCSFHQQFTLMPMHLACMKTCYETLLSVKLLCIESWKS